MKTLVFCCLLIGALGLPSGIRFPGLKDKKTLDEDGTISGEDGVLFPGSKADKGLTQNDCLRAQDFIRFLGSQDDIPMEDFSPLVQDFFQFLDGNTTIDEGIAIGQDDSLVAPQQEDVEGLDLERHVWSGPSHVWWHKPWWPWWKKFAGKPWWFKPSGPWWTKPSTQKPSTPWWTRPTTIKPSPTTPWWTKPTTVKPLTTTPWWFKPTTIKSSTTTPWWTKPTTVKAPSTTPWWTKSSTKPTTIKNPTTSKPTPLSTTPSSNPDSSTPGFNGKIVGLYLLLADETIKEYTSHVNWQPRLHRHQQTGANVLFFTFIHPETMKVPISFKNLAATRGTNQEGAIPQSTKIIFAIGGIGYSLSVNPWDWLTSKAKAEAMAVKVAQWKKLYNIDGIDLDIENGAGDRPEAGKNLIYFIKKIREIEPNMIISQPTFGFPQIPANNEVINAGWSKNGESNGLIDSVGIMVYQGTQSLRYVDNYTNGKNSAITARVPSNKMLVGVEGCASSAALQELAKASVDKDLGGIMVWASSVKNGEGDGLKYGCTAMDGDDTARGLNMAMKMLTRASRVIAA